MLPEVTPKSTETEANTETTDRADRLSARLEAVTRQSARVRRNLMKEDGAEPVEDRLTALDEEQAALRAERQEWQTLLQAQQAQLDEQRAELKQALAQLAVQQQDLAQGRAQLETERQQLQAQLTGQSDDVRRETSELDATRQLIDRARSLAASLPASARAEIVAEADEQEHAEAADKDRDLPKVETRAEVAAPAMQDSLEGNGAETDEDPDDAVFARLRRLSILKQHAHEEDEDHSDSADDATQDRSESADTSDEDAEEARETTRADVQDDEDEEDERNELEQEVEEVEEEEEEQEQPQAHAAPTVSAAHGSGDEESIEDYMARLLNRMRGGVDAPRKPAAEPAQARPTVVQAPVVKAPEAPKPVAAPVQPEPEKFKSTAEMVRRSAPPEVSDMKAMRALANSQARAAIQTHGQKRWAQAAVARWLLSCLALVSGLIGLQMAGDSSVIRVAAMGGLVASLFWAGQAALTSQRYYRERKERGASDSGQRRAEEEKEPA